MKNQRDKAISPARGSEREKLTEAEAAFVRSLLIHGDASILAFSKPSGLSSQGGRGQARTLDDLLVAFAKASGNRPRLVHRLDRDTSGVIVTARTKPAAGFLGKALMARRVKKTYLAIVTPGAPDPRQGLIETPLRRDEQGREAFMRVCDPDHPDAEAASTTYRTLAEGDGAALVELSPKTGRMHQIRVHLASIGRPIAGDARYGGALVLGGEAVGRAMLHAAAIDFPHPDGGRLTIAAPPPEDFQRLAANMSLSSKAMEDA